LHIHIILFPLHIWSDFIFLKAHNVVTTVDSTNLATRKLSENLRSYQEILATRAEQENEPNQQAT
jgi:hypothetical protein